MRGDSQSTSAGRSAGIDIFVSSRDRERAFRRARRHTWLVRTLKLALPLAALGALTLYGGSLLLTSRLKGRDISVSQIRVDPTNLTMEDPRYSGFAKDGSEYKVHAASAVTDLKMSGPVRLNVIDGEIRDPSGTVTKLNARWGTFDQKKDLLELYEQIDVDGSTGMKARLTRATVLTKESRVLSSEPVVAENETGRIRANTMALDTKAKTAAFAGEVEVTLRPTPRAAEATASGTKREARPFGLETSSGVPVVVRSRRLDVDDTKRLALFREEVVAVQAEASLAAPELDVVYEGRSALADPRRAAQSSPQAGNGTTDPAQQSRLKSMHARGGVRMANKGDTAESQTLDYDAAEERVLLQGNVVLNQTPERRVTAETALLDQRADTALLTGGVVVTQGRNLMRGGRLAIDRKAGTARLVSPAEGGRPASRISTTFVQANAGRGPAKPKAAEDEGEQPLGLLGAGFKADPDAPIEVEAVQLDVHDRRHLAIYTGAVVAKQGAFVVRTEEMTAHYSGETGLTASATPTPKDARKTGAATGPGGSELRRIEARRNVVVTGRDGQQATGEWANFDVKANVVVMGGNVTVTQGKQVVRGNEGNRLVINLTTGEAKFEAEPATAAAKSGPQVSGAFATSVTAPPASPGAPGTLGGAALPGCPAGAVCKSGRLEAIFYPNQMKEKAKQKLDATPGATEKAKGAVDAAKDAAQTLRPRSRAKTDETWTTTPRPPTP